MAVQYGQGFYDTAAFHFDFALGADHPEHESSNGPEFQEEHVEVGHLPRLFERLARMEWRLVTSFVIPRRPHEIIFVFRKDDIPF